MTRFTIRTLAIGVASVAILAQLAVATPAEAACALEIFSALPG